MRGNEHEARERMRAIVREARQYPEYATEDEALDALLRYVPTAVPVTPTREALAKGLSELPVVTDPESRVALMLEWADALLAPGGPVTLAETTYGHTCRPDTLEWKFDGGRGAMLCAECRTILGYWQPPKPEPLVAEKEAVARALHDTRYKDVSGTVGQSIAPEERTPREQAAALFESGVLVERAEVDTEVYREAWHTAEAERDVALAVIEKARVEAGSPIDTSRVNDNHAGRALWKAACLARVNAILSSVPSEVSHD